jgi:hypothetical protein
MSGEQGQPTGFAQPNQQPLSGGAGKGPGQATHTPMGTPIVRGNVYAGAPSSSYSPLGATLGAGTGAANILGDGGYDSGISGPSAVGPSAAPGAAGVADAASESNGGDGIGGLGTGVGDGAGPGK